MKVPSTSIKAYKAVVIILIVLLGAPVVKKAFNKLKLRLAGRKESVVMEGT
jgi:simple sugar transport system permease protein